jgi:hypothetical protein
VAIWLINGTAVGPIAALPAVDSACSIVGVADFTGDHKADLLWKHTDGTIGIWGMDGNAITGTFFVGVGDFLPFDGRCAQPNFGRQLLDGFTDHLEIANDRVDGSLIVGERILRESPCIALDPRDGLEDVLQINPRVPGHAKLRRGSSPAAGV